MYVLLGVVSIRLFKHLLVYCDHFISLHTSVSHISSSIKGIDRHTSVSFKEQPKNWVLQREFYSGSSKNNE